jgi:integrase
LLAAARQLGPSGSIRPATYETLFGLMASTGLRVSEALHLRDADVDLKRGMLTIRQTKFAKSRLLPIHPSTVAALAKYRKARARHRSTTTDMPFLISSRGRPTGETARRSTGTPRLQWAARPASAGSTVADTWRHPPA